MFDFFFLGRGFVHPSFAWKKGRKFSQLIGPSNLSGKEKNMVERHVVIKDSIGGRFQDFRKVPLDASDAMWSGIEQGVCWCVQAKKVCRIVSDCLRSAFIWLKTSCVSQNYSATKRTSAVHERDGQRNIGTYTHAYTCCLCHIIACFTLLLRSAPLNS